MDSDVHRNIEGHQFLEKNLAEELYLIILKHSILTIVATSNTVRATAGIGEKNSYGSYELSRQIVELYFDKVIKVYDRRISPDFSTDFLCRARA